jgi:hypothetical protein
MLPAHYPAEPPQRVSSSRSTPLYQRQRRIVAYLDLGDVASIAGV